MGHGAAALLLATGARALDTKWTPAPGAENVRFSQRHREASGVDDAEWAQTDWQVWLKRWATVLDDIAALYGVSVQLVQAAVMVVFLLVLFHRQLWRRLMLSRSNAVASTLLADEAKSKAEKAQARQLEAQARVAKKRDGRPTVRTCRFCDIPVEADEFMEGHVRGKRHVRLAAAAGVHGTAAEDCWIWCEAPLARPEAEDATALAPEPAQLVAPSKGGRWEKVGAGKAPRGGGGGEATRRRK